MEQFLHAHEITHGMNTTESPSLILTPNNTIRGQTLLLSAVVLVFFLLNALRNYTTHLSSVEEMSSLSQDALKKVLTSRVSEQKEEQLLLAIVNFLFLEQQKGFFPLRRGCCSLIYSGIPMDKIVIIL